MAQEIHHLTTIEYNFESMDSSTPGITSSFTTYDNIENYWSTYLEIPIKSRNNKSLHTLLIIQGRTRQLNSFIGIVGEKITIDAEWSTGRFDN